MTIKTISLRVAVVAGILAVSACGDDTALNPTFGAQCSAGSLAAGQSKDGAITPADCEVPYHFWSGDRTYYESYSVALEKGRGYYFHMQRRNDVEAGDGIDSFLALFGKNADGVSVPLAVSDDDAGGSSSYDSEFYFIAPRSGTFQLVTYAYSAADTGGYRVSMERCPVVATLDTAGVYENLELGTSPCIRRATDAGGYVTPIVLVSVPVIAGEDITLSVSSDDFTPVAEAGGPGFDVYANLYDGQDFDAAEGSGGFLSLTSLEADGSLTLAVGATSFGDIGRFSVNLTRSLVVSAYALPAPQTLRSPLTPRTPKRR